MELGQQKYGLFSLMPNSRGEVSFIVCALCARKVAESSYAVMIVSNIYAGNVIMHSHFFNPLHARVYKTSKNYSTEQLLSTEFMNEFGKKIEKGTDIVWPFLNSAFVVTLHYFLFIDVPVTCFPPSRCWSCNELDTCVLNTGTNDVTVITVKGIYGPIKKSHTFIVNRKSLQISVFS
jgi:hypothetical protein